MALIRRGPKQHKTDIGMKEILDTLLPLCYYCRNPQQINKRGEIR